MAVPMRINDDTYNGIISLVMGMGYEARSARRITDKYCEAILKAIQNVDQPTYAKQIGIYEKKRVYMDEINTLKTAGTPCLPNPQDLPDDQIDTTEEYIGRIRQDMTHNAVRFTTTNTDADASSHVVVSNHQGFASCAAESPAHLVRFRDEEIIPDEQVASIAMTEAAYDNLVHGSKIDILTYDPKAPPDTLISAKHDMLGILVPQDQTEQAAGTMVPTLVDMAAVLKETTCIMELVHRSTPFVKTLRVMNDDQQRRLIQTLENHVESIMETKTPISSAHDLEPPVQSDTLDWASAMIQLVTQAYLEDVNDFDDVFKKIDVYNQVLEDIKPKDECDLPLLQKPSDPKEAALIEWVTRAATASDKVTVHQGFLSLSDVTLEKENADSDHLTYSHIRTIQPSSMCLTQHARHMVSMDLKRLEANTERRDELDVKRLESRLNDWVNIMQQHRQPTIDQPLLANKSSEDGDDTAEIEDEDEDEKDTAEIEKDDINEREDEMEAEDNEYDLDLELAISDLSAYRPYDDAEDNADEDAGRAGAQGHVNTDLKLSLLRHLTGSMGIRPNLAVDEQAMLMGYVVLLVKGTEESQLQDKIEEVRSRYKEFVAKYGKNYNEAVVIKKLQAQFMTFILVENATYMVLLLQKFLQIHPDRLKMPSVKPCKKRASDWLECVVLNGLKTFVDEDAQSVITEEVVKRWMTIAASDINAESETILFDGRTYSRDVVMKSISTGLKYQTPALKNIVKGVQANHIELSTRNRKRWIIPSCCKIDTTSLSAKPTAWKPVSKSTTFLTDAAKQGASLKESGFSDTISVQGELISKAGRENDKEIIEEDDQEEGEGIEQLASRMNGLHPFRTDQLIKELGIDQASLDKIDEQSLNQIGTRFITHTLVPSDPFYYDNIDRIHRLGVGFDVCIFAISQLKDDSIAQMVFKLNTVLHVMA